MSSLIHHLTALSKRPATLAILLTSFTAPLSAESLSTAPETCPASAKSSSQTAQKETTANLKSDWLELAIHAQNAGHKIHMLGVESDSSGTKAFSKDISAIDHVLNKLVNQGVLKKKKFTLKPQLDLEDALITAVGHFVQKAAKQYGYYSVREMMDIGTRQKLKEFDDAAPTILNVRMPASLLAEFEKLLKEFELSAESKANGINRNNDQSNNND